MGNALGIGASAEERRQIKASRQIDKALYRDGSQAQRKKSIGVMGRPGSGRSTLMQQYAILFGGLTIADEDREQSSNLVRAHTLSLFQRIVQQLVPASLGWYMLCTYAAFGTLAVLPREVLDAIGTQLLVAEAVPIDSMDSLRYLCSLSLHMDVSKKDSVEDLLTSGRLFLESPTVHRFLEDTPEGRRLAIKENSAYFINQMDRMFDKSFEATMDDLLRLPGHGPAQVECGEPAAYESVVRMIDFAPSSRAGRTAIGSTDVVIYCADMCDYALGEDGESSEIHRTIAHFQEVMRVVAAENEGKGEADYYTSTITVMLLLTKVDRTHEMLQKVPLSYSIDDADNVDDEFAVREHIKKHFLCGGDGEVNTSYVRCFFGCPTDTCNIQYLARAVEELIAPPFVCEMPFI